MGVITDLLSPPRGVNLAVAIADAEVEMEMAEIDYPLPPLLYGAVQYLDMYTGHRGRLELESRKVAARYGSMGTQRLHVVIALRQLNSRKEA